jgi:integrase
MTSEQAPRHGWREAIEPGIYRVHRIGCPSSTDEKPGRRCSCPYSVRVPGGTGTSRTLKVPGTREDARRERAKRIGAGKQVVVVPMGESTVHELALDYFAANAPSWQASTTELADGLYKSWVMPKWGETIASTLTKADIVLWMASGRATKAPRRADQALSLRRRILGHATDSTPPKLPQNVALGVKPPKAKQAAHATFTPAQADALVAACKTARDRVLVLLGLHGGLRIGEARGLRWCDLALDEKRIRVERAVWQGKGRERHVKEPKSDRRRRVFVTPALASALAELRAEVLEKPGFAQTDYVLAAARASRWRARADTRPCSASPIGPG